MADDVTLVQLEYFRAVVEAGSMTGAAEDLNLTQSAVSSAVSALERRLGVDLLRRIPRRGVEPTLAGRRLLGAAQRLLADAAGLGALVRGGGTVSGRITISIYSPLAPIYAPRLALAVGRAFPGLEVKLVEEEHDQLWASVLSGASELALAYDIGMDVDWSVEPLWDLPPHLLLADDHPLAARGARGALLAEVAEEPAVLLSTPVSLNHYLGYFRALGLEPRLAHTSRNYEAVRAYVAHGLGYSILNHLHPEHAERAAGLASIPLRDVLEPARLCMVSPAGQPDSSRAAACRGLIRAVVDDVRSTSC